MLSLQLYSHQSNAQINIFYVFSFHKWLVAAHDCQLNFVSRNHKILETNDRECIVARVNFFQSHCNVNHRRCTNDIQYLAWQEQWKLKIVLTVLTE